MERSIEVATGEGVNVSYELAGLGSRFLAIMVDLVVQVAVALALGLLFAWLEATLFARLGATPLAKLARSVLSAVLIALLFADFIGYFIVCEWRFDGRTLGKRALGIRVVRDGGFPLDPAASVVRNAVRIVEFAFGFYLLSGICALVSPNNRRLGDYAAGTLVVRDAAPLRAQPLAPDDGAGDPLLAALGARERELVRAYAARRGSL
ncbi:MAG: RDD family protein, partial [Candidatus Dormibacteria bacterium]